MEQFIEKASVADLDLSCVAGVQRPMFFSDYTGPRVGAATTGDLKGVAE